MTIRFIPLALALCIGLPSAAGAAWDLRQTSGLAVIEQTVGDVTVTFQCLGRVKNQLNVGLSRPGGWPEVPPAVMLWITLPDGRTDRQSMDAFGEDGQLSATLMTSDVVLENLRQAASLEFTIAGTGRTIVTTDARGTGAFRLAVQEQCGF